MFKYQHVCCGSCHNFIVTCPRASTPEGCKETYPFGKYYRDMISLGFDLMHTMKAMTQKVSYIDSSGKDRDMPFRARNVRMKVGLSSGPAAGVVLGRCRRFYCIYGDTVNTAARMCKFSIDGSIRVTRSIGSHTDVSTSNWFKSQSQGSIPIKGKGNMEVFDIRLNRQAFFARKASTRVAVTRNRTRFGRIGSGVNITTSSGASDGSSGCLPTASVPPTTASLETPESMAPALAVDVEPSPQDTSLVNRQIDAKSLRQEEEKLNMWVEKRYTLSRLIPRFSSPKTEQDYLQSKSQLLASQRGMTIGIVFHLLSCAWQWNVFVWPDYDGRISVATGVNDHGNPELKWRIHTIQVLLAIQFAIAIMAGCLIFFILGNFSIGAARAREFCILHGWITDPSQWTLNDELSEATDLLQRPRVALSRRSIRKSEVLFVLLKILNLGIGLSLSWVWPSRRDQGVTFSLYSMSGFCISQTIFGVSFEGNCILILLSIPVLLVATSLPLQESLSGLQFAEEHVEAFTSFRTNLLIGCAASFVSSIGSAHFVCLYSRRVWRRERFHSAQLKKMHNLLLDLVPPVYAKQLIQGCKHMECSSGRVVVLQLDICNFTVISQSLTPTKLADIINDLVSAFDKYVMRRNLIKIDTM